MDRIQFRKEAIRRRNAIDERSLKSALIADQLFQLEVYQRAGTVFLYLSYRSEVETDKILKQVWKDGKNAAAPLVAGVQMEFRRIRDMSDLQSGAYGIREPKNECEIVIPSAGDLVLVPGCAFSRRGGRMGYGKGCYDRYLEGREDCFWLGLAFEEQLNEALPMLPHDKRMHGILTQERYYPVMSPADRKDAQQKAPSENLPHGSDVCGAPERKSDI